MGGGALGDMIARATTPKDHTIMPLESGIAPPCLPESLGIPSTHTSDGPRKINERFPDASRREHVQR